MTPGGFLGLVILLLAVYCGLDPLNHSAISEFPDFVSHKVDMPPWSLIPTVKDDKNLLQNSEIKFLNQIQGPESMAFDPLGRGPYTGVADGRILFWDGLKWTDFAFTSNNRSVYDPGLCLFLLVFWIFFWVIHVIFMVTNTVQFRKFNFVFSLRDQDPSQTMV